MQNAELKELMDLAKAASVNLDEQQARTGAARSVRNDACAGLVRAGIDYADIARLIGTTRSLVWSMFNPKSGTYWAETGQTPPLQTSITGESHRVSSEPVP